MRFEIKHPEDENRANILEQSYGISRLTARILAARGFSDHDAAEYLWPDEQQLLSPFEFDAMGEVCERIEEAVTCGEKIAVYSDYDTDGICAAAIMYKCIEYLGAQPIMYVPDRFTEGYGTNAKAIGELCKEVSLIISVDCGIRSVEDVKLARSMGVDFIIADHHECGDIPDTPFILNPKKPDENYPFKHLCGAGIAFKIAYAMIDDEDVIAQILQYAAVATIADMVMLRGENRAIASLGLRSLRNAPAVGWLALSKAAGIDITKANSMDVGFALSPRINAAGRMANGRLSLELLIANDEKKADELAARLNELNMRRQQLQRAVADKCTAQISKLNLSRTKMLVAYDDEFDEGVVGLAASLLAEKYHRPAVVFKRTEGKLIGSARSIEGIDLYAVLDSCADLYEKFGGHEMAAGLTMPEKNLESFIERTGSFIENRYTSDSFVNTIKYDLEIDPGDVTMEDAQSLDAMEPFGEGNERPVFLFKGAQIGGVRRIGADGRHAKLKAGALDMVYFNAPQISDGAKSDICGEIGVNEYNGKKSVQVIVRSFFQKTVAAGADRMSFIKGFPAEICALYEMMRQPEKYDIHKSAREWREAVLSRANDPIGMAVMVGDLIGESAFRALEIDGIDVINGEPSKYRSENAIIMHCANADALSNFDDIFLCGGISCIAKYPDAHILMNSGLYKAYKTQAERFYVPWERAMDYYRAFAACKPGDSISQMLMSLENAQKGFTMEKLWYMFNVFKEQKLIEAKKSDKIIFISNEKPSRRSMTKLAFETVLK